MLTNQLWRLSMSNYHHKVCGGEVVPHENQDMGFCCSCGRWIDDVDDIFIKWDIMGMCDNDVAMVNG